MRLPKSASDLSNYPYICIDEKNYIPEATVFLITGKDIDRICAFLCSEVGFFVFVKYYSGPAFDDTGFRFKKQYLLNLPIPDFMIDIDGNYERNLVAELGLTNEEANIIYDFKASLLKTRNR